MRWFSLVGRRPRRSHAERKLSKNRAFRSRRFEHLEARQMLAGDFAAEIAGAAMFSPESDSSSPAYVAEWNSVVETPAKLKNAGGTNAGIGGKIADLPTSEQVNGIRQLEQTEKLKELFEQSRGLPGQDYHIGQETDFAKDPRQYHDGMYFMPHAAPEGGGLMDLPGPPSPGQGGGDSQPLNPFARLGWVSDRWTVEYREESYVDSRNNVIRVTSDWRDGERIITRTFARPDQSSTHRTIHYYYDNDTVVDTTRYYDADGNEAAAPTVTKRRMTEEERRHNYFHAEMVFTKEERDDPPDDEGSQPNPEDGTDDWGPLNNDPWRAFFAWYTGEKAPEIFDPRDPADDDESGHGETSSAPPIGPEAVTQPNPEALTGNTGGGAPYDPKDPMPIGPVPLS